jgi:hypothetical protein
VVDVAQHGDVADDFAALPHADADFLAVFVAEHTHRTGFHDRHYCRYGKRVLRNALDNFIQQQKRMLLENEQRRGFLPSLLGGVVKIMRRVKRSNFRPAS